MVDADFREFREGAEASEVVQIAKVVESFIWVFDCDFDGLGFLEVEVKDGVVETGAVPPSLEGRKDDEL